MSDDNSLFPQPQSKPPKAHIWQLFPLWLAAIGVVMIMMIGFGFTVGRISTSAEPAPGATVTVFATPPPVAVTSNAALPESPSPLPGVTDSASAAPSAGTTRTPGTGGAQLAAYDFKMVYSYSAPLGDVAPTQAQFSPNNTTGDIYLHNYGPIYPVGTNTFLALDGGGAPTYDRCKTTPLFISQASSTKGYSFCMKGNGRMVGITVTDGATQPVASVTMHVVVWQD